MSARKGWQHKGGRGVKILLPNRKRNQLSRFGGKINFAPIVTEVATKEPHAGNFIQSSALKIKCPCIHKSKELIDRQVRLREMIHSL